MNVDKYVYPIHEGVYNLGPNSLKKQASQKEKVGRKFMDRALQDHEEFIEDYLLDTIFGAAK